MVAYVNWFGMQLNYMLAVTPCLLGAVVNMAVLYTFKRSIRLHDHPLPFRQDIAFNFALGTIAYFVANVILTFIPLSREIPSLCSGASFLAFVAIDAVKISAVLSVLCRYLTAFSPYSRLGLFLLKRDDISVLVWPVVVALNLPQAFLHEVHNLEEELLCGRLDTTTAYQIFLVLFYGVPLAGYFVANHLLVRNVDLENPDGDIQNPFNRTLRQGAALVRLLVAGYVIIFVPMIVIVFVDFGFAEGIHVTGMYCAPLCIMLSFVEPMCFALPDETFRNELRLHLGLDRAFRQEQHEQQLATPNLGGDVANSLNSEQPAILTLN